MEFFLFNYLRKRIINRHSILKILFLIFFIIIIKLVYIFVPEFFSIINIMNLLRRVSILGTIAIGTTMVIIIGGIDLSPAAGISLAIAFGGMYLLETGNFVIAFFIFILCGAILGFLNGLLIEYLKLNHVIVTLSTMMAGMAIAIIKAPLTIRISNPILLAIGRGYIGPIPIPILIMFFLYFMAYLLLNKTSFGRLTYLIGNNERAAYLIGVNTKKHKLLIYIIAGMLAGFAGLLSLGRMAIIQTGFARGIEFEALTIVVLGGARLEGGIGKLQGTFIAAILLSAVSNLLILMGVSIYLKQAILGFSIILAIIFSRLLINIRMKKVIKK